MVSILFNITVNRTRVAVIDKQRQLQHYDEESKYSKMEKNSIYSATICSIRPEIGACFVKYDGEKKDGFLPFDSIAPHYYNMTEAPEDTSEIGKKLKAGSKLLVQVKKDQISHESKGAALTTHLSLAGTYLVLLPYNNKQTVSRKADTQQRDQIKEIIAKLEIPENIGVIIRTAGINKTLEELNWDYQALMKQWKCILKMYEASTSPELLHEEDSIIVRNIRDNISLTTEKIVVNDPQAYATIRQYLENTRPELIENEKLELYTYDKPMFGHYSVEEQVEAIFNTEIKLPSGGSIVVQGTEAGYMIDVNSGKSTVGTNIEETALNTNLEAAAAAAKIIKLRDIGGIIIIDFIDLSDREDQKKVEQAFESATSTDRAKIKFEPISPMNGVMNLLRQRLGVPFFESSLTPIEGDQSIVAGKKRSVDSYASFILHVLENSAYHDTNVIQIQLPIDVTTFILNEERDRVSSIEKRYNVDIKIIPNASFKSYRYTLKRFRISGDTSQHAQPKSYEQIIDEDTEQPWMKVTDDRKSPQMKKNSYSQTITKKHHGAKQQPTGVFSQLWSAMFGEEPSKKSSTQHKSNRQHDNKRPHNKRHHKKPQHAHSNRSRGAHSNKDNTQGNSEKGNNQQRGLHGNRRRQNNRRPRNHQEQPAKSDNVVNENLIDHYGD